MKSKKLTCFLLIGIFAALLALALPSQSQIIGGSSGVIGGGSQVSGTTSELSIVKPSNFSFIFIPDAQYLTGDDTFGHVYPNEWTNLCNFIKNRRTQWNIKAVIGLGDIVDVPNATNYARATTGYNALVSALIPAYPCMGNHDYDGQIIPNNAYPLRNGAVEFNTAWPSTFASNQASYGGVYPDTGATTESSLSNYWMKQTIGSQKFLFMMLEPFPRQNVIDWAKTVVAANTDHYVIVVSHSILGADGTFDEDGDTDGASTYVLNTATTLNGQEMWDNFLSLYPNIILTVSGHHPIGKFATKTSTGANGNTVISVFCDYQQNDYDHTPIFAAIMRVTFYPEVRSIDVEPISTVSGVGDPAHPKITLALPSLTPIVASGRRIAGGYDSEGNVFTTYGQKIGWGTNVADAVSPAKPPIESYFSCLTSGGIDANVPLQAPGIYVRDAYGNYASLTASHKDTATTDNRLFMNLGEAHDKGIIFHNQSDASILTTYTAYSCIQSSVSLVLNPPTNGYTFLNLSRGVYVCFGTGAGSVAAGVSTTGDFRTLNAAKIGWGATGGGDPPTQEVYFTRAANGQVILNRGLATTAQAVTITDPATTFAVTSNVVLLTGATSGRTLTTITGGVSGQILVIKCQDSNVGTFTDTAAATADTMNIAGAFASAAGKTLTLMYDGTKWFEIARATN